MFIKPVMSVETQYIWGANAYNLEYLGIKQTETDDNMYGLILTKTLRSSTISILIGCNDDGISIDKRNYVKAIIKRNNIVLITGYININFGDALDINTFMILCSRYNKKELPQILRIHHYY